MIKAPTMRAAKLGMLAALMMSVSGHAMADPPGKVRLKPSNVTIRVFGAVKGVANGQDYVLLVDSPDAEYAASSTMANAVSFTKKIENGTAMPVAFTCIKVEPL